MLRRIAVLLSLTLAVVVPIDVVHGQPPAPGVQPAPMPGTPPATSPVPQRPPRPGTPGLPPRDPTAAPAGTGTSVIRGRTLSAETGQPLRRVAVRLMAAEMRQQKMALSDNQGLFEFKALPAGRYQLMASKGGYANTAYGARRPGQMGRPLDLAEGQTIENIDLSLALGGVITGRIVDEFGEPIAEAQVVPLRYRYVNGRRRPTMAGSFGQSNDVGHYRLFGLVPGEYLVSATLRAGGMMSFGMEETGGDGTGYAPTYFPGTASPGEAQRVEVTAGNETVVDIQLIPTRVSRVSGAVVDSTGKPARGGMIIVQPRESDAMVMPTMNMNQIRPDGTFTISGLPPGEYVLDVRANPDVPSAAGRGGSGNPFESRELAYVPLTAAGEDIDGLRIVTGPGVTVSGQVVFEEGQPPAEHDMRVNLMPDADGPRMGMNMAQVAADGTFELPNVFGPRRVMVNAPRGWMVKSIAYRGREVLDEVVEFHAGGPVGRLHVVLTSRVTSVQGGVQDDSGRSLSDYSIMVFPADPARKPSPFGGFGGAKPDQQGRYKIEGLRPGRYLAIALADVADEDRFDPDFIDRLRDKATPFELREGETRTLQLTLTPQP